MSPLLAMTHRSRWPFSCTVSPSTSTVVEEGAEPSHAPPWKPHATRKIPVPVIPLLPPLYSFGTPPALDTVGGGGRRA
ncbi:hypothetical protein Taro_027415 [Colocasia esculenta]|uniref:Uncharacterized protein n=1 Tax=Colocasia esculenta TaxID=4460 RepID=A0A843VK39_COLES|nr:hypothetical protein [Colocasia esculenta]